MQNYACVKNDFYLSLTERQNLFVFNAESIAFDKFKIKTQNLKIIEQDGLNFTIQPIDTGKATVQVFIKTKNKESVILSRDFEVVKLPEMKLELSTSSPDHDFIWLRLLDTKSSVDITEHYNLCVLDFTLRDSAGTIKGKGPIHNSNFFPSVNVKELNQKFEIGDRLEIAISVIHKKYQLLQHVPSQIKTIDHLWK